MVNSKTTLQEFIQYIPLLNKDCPLQSVVSAIYSSSQRMIALVHEDGTPKGIIYSYLLLESIKEKVSKKQNEDYSKVTEISLSKVSIPLIALTCQTKIKDFFDYFLLENQRQKQDYWIVDEKGKLLGILNIPKLLQVLCFEQAWRENELSKELNKISISTVSKVLDSNTKVTYSYSNKQKALSKKYSHQNTITSLKETKFTTIKTQTRLNLKRLNYNFNSLFDKCSFPLAIENERGDICYQNKYWHEEILIRQRLSYELKAKQYDAEWRLELDKKVLDYQRKESNFKNINYKKRTKNYDYCPTVKVEVNRVHNSQLQQQVLKKINTLDFKKTQSLNIKKASNKTLEESFGNYYRIPLRINGDEINISDRPNYWLIFATQFPLFEDISLSNSHDITLGKLKQLRDELILNITHDLKSPLTAIIGLSSLLKETSIDNTQENQLRYSQMIYKSGKKLINLINDFLNINRLTTEKFALNLEFIKIENFCKQIYFQAQEKIKTVVKTSQNDAIFFPQLQFDIDSNAPDAIADKACLVQIMSCFLENAIELAKPESKIIIKTQLWSDWLAITVRNQGKGLLEVEQDFLVTKPQDNNFLTSHEKNRKLGLMLAQQLAQSHGGDISLISQDDYGSQFTLLLPKSDRMINDDSENKTNCLVLIVETSSARIINLSDRLKALGYQCVVAKNQEDALYKARCFKPYKIIINSSFIKSNEDIVKTFKSNSATHNIPIVVVIDDSSEERAKNWNTEFYTRNQHYLDTLNESVEEFISFPCKETTLTNLFTPLSSSNSSKQNFTVLRLSLTEKNTQNNNSPSDFVFENPSFNLSHHIIEADSIEQADLLATIWNIDVIIWDSINLDSPQNYLESLAEFDTLADIPLITLDTQSTKIANKITSLTVFPCLLPANKRSIKKLSQVIQIAAGCRGEIG